MDMLGMFFKNDQHSLHPTQRGYGTQWRFKPHAERPFWRWLSSWARAVRRPSDLGFDDGAFRLPALHVSHTVVKASRPLDGHLFAVPAVGLAEQRQERKHTLRERCEAAAAKAATDQPIVLWCHLNAEGDLLEELIPGARQVYGSQSEEEKEEILEAFASGQIRALVTKPTIAGFGLNWQHCQHMTFFPSHSFEQYYQAVRRCWRFGQQRDVQVDLITTEGEANVMANLQRKAEAADEAFAAIVREMWNELSIRQVEQFQLSVEVPTWA
jgi:hypothetical protein